MSWQGIKVVEKDPFTVFCTTVQTDYGPEEVCNPLLERVLDYMLDYHIYQYILFPEDYEHDHWGE